MIKIAILGSTGSIGTQTLDIVRKNKDLEVVGIAAGSNIAMLEEQIREFHPKLAAVGDEKKAEELSVRVKDTNCKVVGGMDGLLELAAMEESQILVTAIVGMIGIRPTIEGIKAGKDIALANKETLVTAGHLIMPLSLIHIFEVPVVIDKIFREHPEMKEEVQEKLEKYNLKEATVEPQNPNTTKKFTKQHLMTDTGIELKIPMEEYNNKDRIEFITNPDGTISVLIKNIGSIESR